MLKGELVKLLNRSAKIVDGTLAQITNRSNSVCEAPTVDTAQETSYASTSTNLEPVCNEGSEVE